MMRVTRLVSTGLFDVVGATSVRSECWQASLWLCLTEIVRMPHLHRIRTREECIAGLGLPELESVHLCLQQQADLVFVCQRVVDKKQKTVSITEKWIVQKCMHRGGVRKALHYAPGILTVPREVRQLITQFAEKNADSLEFARQTTLKIPKPVIR